MIKWCGLYLMHVEDVLKLKGKEEDNCFDDEENCLNDYECLYLEELTEDEAKILKKKEYTKIKVKSNEKKLNTVPDKECKFGLKRDNMKNIDFTSIVERIEPFEKKMGVVIDRISCFRDDRYFKSNGWYEYIIHGEVRAINGPNINESFSIKADGLDEKGRIIDTNQINIEKEKFLSFSSFHTSLMPSIRLHKIRIYPVFSD